MAALQQLGKLVNPVTNEEERDLEQAKAAIDMIEMIKEDGTIITIMKTEMIKENGTIIATMMTGSIIKKAAIVITMMIDGIITRKNTRKLETKIDITHTTTADITGITATMNHTG